MISNSSDLPFFSVCIPSNRSLTNSLPSLLSAKNFCETSRAEMVISDNSEDAAKASVLAEWKNTRYMNSPGLELMPNFINALKNARGEFTAFLSDDDFIMRFADFQMPESRDFIGIQPTFLYKTKEQGLVGSLSFDISSNSAVDRISEYMTKCQGRNTALFSFYSRQLHWDLMNLCYEYHPTNGGYQDWAITCALVSSGKIIHDKNAALVYSLDNWSNPEVSFKTLSGLFQKSGLAGKELFLNFLMALDSFILVNRHSSPLGPNERLNAATHAMTLYFKSFFQTVQQNPQAFKDYLPLIEMIMESSSQLEVFENSARLLDAIDGGLVEKYKKFYFCSIKAPWGEVKS